MRKLALRALVLLAIGTGTVLPIATPAQAAQSDCPPEYTCIWDDRNFSGARWQGKGDNAFPENAARDNKGSSAYNNGRNCWVYLWTDRNYAGVNLPMALGAYRASMNLDPGPSPVGSWEDVVSSFHWCSPR